MNAIGDLPSDAAVGEPGTGTPSIHAVIVTFDPDANFPARLKAISSQFARVWIVDNGGGIESRLRSASNLDLQNVDVLPQAGNRGIAAAINIGVAAAANAAAKWVALFDHDTVCPENYGRIASEAAEWATDRKDCALFAPEYEDAGTVLQRRREEVGHGSKYPETTDAITSGSVVRVEPFQLLGGYETAMFIDYVDFEYLLRLQARGYTVHSLPARLKHSVGNVTKHRLGSVVLTTTNHAVFRLYTSGHNLAFVLRRHGSSHLRASTRFVVSEGKRLIKVALFEDMRWLKIRAWYSGFFKAIRNRESTVTREDIEYWRQLATTAR